MGALGKTPVVLPSLDLPIGAEITAEPPVTMIVRLLVAETDGDTERKATSEPETVLVEVTAEIDGALLLPTLALMALVLLI
jgi:hypothetical protein